MLQRKDTQKLSELKNSFTHSWLEPDFIYRSLKCFSFSQLNRALSFFKVKGYRIEWVLSMLITMPFVGINTVNQLSGHVEAQKDVFYRLKNNASVCWRYILWMFAIKFCKRTRLKTAGSTAKCLIFDDTLLAKSGKYIEHVSRVWDHVQNKGVLGFKLLVLGYWDGVSFLPLDFSLHKEVGKNKQKPCGLRPKDLRRQYKKDRKPGSHSYDRANEAGQSKIAAMLRMLKRAVAHKIDFEYVLTDSWFTCEALIEAVCAIKGRCVHLIGMYSKAKTLFGFRDKRLTYSQIRNQLGKPKRCRKLKLYYLQAVVSYNGWHIQLFFSKQGKNGKWKTILTTDTRLSFLQMLELYQTRWTIEVFFKESKQLLGLGNCQSNNFDAHIADTTIAMIRHILLTFRHRYENYESKGALFAQTKEDIAQIRLSERLWGLFVELLNIITELFDEVDITSLFEKLINDDQSMQRITRLLQPPDSQKSAA